MECELCGRHADLRKGKVEGVILSLCPQCLELGEVVAENENKAKKVITHRNINEPSINHKFASIIKKAREKENLTRNGLADKLNIKESLLANLEKGKMYPSLSVAKKLEKGLCIDLTHYEMDEVKCSSSTPPSLTLGDVAEIKEK